MRRLSQIVLLLVWASRVVSQSPHGDELTIACADCHTAKGWELEKGSYAFDHNQTSFPLEGLHEDASCRLCHPTLIFNEAEPECMSCHTDIHEQTVGFECDRCHTPRSWIVANITEVHRLSRFPLLGAHNTADCYQCHPSASLLQFEPLGVECIDCHQADYLATTQPDHQLSGFSTECSECHDINAFLWTGIGFNHDFFPLTEGHALNNCAECHLPGEDYANTSRECFSCHQTDYSTATNPNHYTANISTQCDECHTTAPDWKPAEFLLHDAQYFPVYSGSHNGEWINCAECHTNPGNYGVFTCIDCHEHNQPEMNDEHEGIGGYIYESIACFECHPTGEAEEGFNHNASAFPLTGAHTMTACIDCHTEGYAGTTTICYECHTSDFNQSTNPDHLAIGIGNECELCHSTAPDWMPATFDMHSESYPLTGAHAEIQNNCYDCHEGDYNNTPNACAGCHTPQYDQSVNPNHTALGLSFECEMCHTTQPDWMPANFPVHNEYYMLEGAHAAIANDCFTCHEGNYVTTPNTCYACHIPEYNQTTDPSHTAAQFPTECEVCHNQLAWEPSTFNHDGQFFPIYSGEHAGEWDMCSDCHNDPTNYAVFTCLTCHLPGPTNDEHEGIPGYAYNSEACLACHPDGSSTGAFNHNVTSFPLTGAHTAVLCNDCHTTGYTGTPTDCAECHSTAFNQSINPNHVALGIPNDCALCHSTEPGWQPAGFPIHNNYYVLEGAHMGIAEDCFECHEGNYNSTPNTCYGCHASDYNQTNDPSHLSAQFPTTCDDCHTQNSWVPSTFDHDGQYFPIYSGEHQGEWEQCSDCHNNPGNYALFTCLTCHEQGEMDDEHEDVTGYVYNSMACLECHPDGSSDKKIYRFR